MFSFWPSYLRKDDKLIPVIRLRYPFIVLLEEGRFLGHLAGLFGIACNSWSQVVNSSPTLVWSLLKRRREEVVDSKGVILKEQIQGTI